MQFGEKEIRIFNNPEGVKQYFTFNPFGVLRHLPYLLFSELHSELFKFNAFSVFRFVGNVQRWELAPNLDFQN